MLYTGYEALVAYSRFCQLVIIIGLGILFTYLYAFLGVAISYVSIQALFILLHVIFVRIKAPLKPTFLI